MDIVEQFTGGIKFNIGSDKGVGKSIFSNSTGDTDHNIDTEYEKSFWGTGNTTIMDSSVCVLKGLVGILGIGKYGSVLVKNIRNWKKRYLRICIKAHYF